MRTNTRYTIAAVGLAITGAVGTQATLAGDLAYLRGEYATIATANETATADARNGQRTTAANAQAAQLRESAEEVRATSADDAVTAVERVGYASPVAKRAAVNAWQPGATTATAYEAAADKVLAENDAAVAAETAAAVERAGLAVQERVDRDSRIAWLATGVFVSLGLAAVAVNVFPARKRKECTV